MDCLVEPLYSFSEAYYALQWHGYGKLGSGIVLARKGFDMSTTKKRNGSRQPDKEEALIYN